MLKDSETSLYLCIDSKPGKKVKRNLNQDLDQEAENELNTYLQGKNLEGGNKVTIQDLCKEDKMKIGVLVQTFATKLAAERQEKESLKSKYEQAMKDFELIKAQYTQPSPSLQIKKQMYLNTEIADSDSDLELNHDMGRCVTQTSFHTKNPPVEPLGLPMEEISKLREEVKQLSLSIKELSAEKGSKAKSRVKYGYE